MGKCLKIHTLKMSQPIPPSIKANKNNLDDKVYCNLSVKSLDIDDTIPEESLKKSYSETTEESSNGEYETKFKMNKKTQPYWPNTYRTWQEIQKKKHNETSSNKSSKTYNKKYTVNGLEDQRQNLKTKRPQHDMQIINEIDKEKCKNKPSKLSQKSLCNSTENDSIKEKHKVVSFEHDLHVNGVHFRETKLLTRITPLDCHEEEESSMIHVRHIDNKIYEVTAKRIGKKIMKKINTQMTKEEIDEFKQNWRKYWTPKITDDVALDALKQLKI